MAGLILTTRRYILDTNVLMHNPTSLFNFQEHDVYIPYEVLGELGKFKKGNAEINVNAREAIRTINRLIGGGFPEDGIPLEVDGKPVGGRLHFLLPEDEKDIGLEDRVEENYVDTVLIKRAKRLHEQNPEDETILVTQDTGFRIRVGALRIPNLKAEDYLHDKVDFNLHKFFESTQEYYVDQAVMAAVHHHGMKGTMVPEMLRGSLEDNQYLILRHGTSQSYLVQHRKGQLYPLREPNIGKIKPRNQSQRFLLDACFNPDITIVSALGKAGTGKTLLTLAAALHQVMYEESKRYVKVIVFRPTKEIGESLGYLPGDVHDKIGPYFRAIDTAIEVIFGGNLKYHVKPEQSDHYIKVAEEMKRHLEKMPINFARGDTYHRSFIIVDEAQNLTKQELKTLGTRMGEGSKMVVTGDPFQIDNPYLDEKNNGLTAMTHSLKGKVPEFAYIILEKGERSREADIFADYL